MVVTETTRHLTASMVVIDPDTASVLLVHHLAHGLWLFPGGHVDEGETPAQAVVREVLEETGITARLVGDPAVAWQVKEAPAPAKPERPGKPAEPAHTHIDLLFVGTADRSDPLTAQLDEVADARWVPIGDLAGLDVRAEVPQVARDAYRLLRGVRAEAGS